MKPFNFGFNASDLIDHAHVDTASGLNINEHVHVDTNPIPHDPGGPVEGGVAAGIANPGSIFVNPGDYTPEAPYHGDGDPHGWQFADTFPSPHFQEETPLALQHDLAAIDSGIH